MSLDNPYAAPEFDWSETAKEPRESELASRWTRFAAAFVDGIIGMAVGFGILYLFGVWDYIARRQAPPLGLMLATSVLGFAGFLLLHGYLLKTNGQTIGKKLLGIRIVDLNGNLPDFWTLILRRYLPLTLVGHVPWIGQYLPLVDVLFIFREDRRCVHDLIAGTKVVVAKGNWSKKGDGVDHDL